MAFPTGKLGKQAPRHDSRTLKLARYRLASAPTPPPQADWSKKVTNWPMMLNDQLGDCTCAAAGHMIEQWSTYNGAAFIPPDSAILQAYEAVSGYDPVTGQGDSGAVMLNVLNYWRQTGIAGHRILAFTAVDPNQTQDMRDAVYLFGNCYLGLALPLSAQNQRVWSVPSGGTRGPGSPGSWGGHCVPVVAYDPQGLTVVTWGELVRMTWGFLACYCDEAYAVLSQDWIQSASHTSPGHFDLATLQADLEALQAGH